MRAVKLHRGVRRRPALSRRVFAAEPAVFDAVAGFGQQHGGPPVGLLAAEGTENGVQVAERNLAFEGGAAGGEGGRVFHGQAGQRQQQRPVGEQRRGAARGENSVQSGQVVVRGTRFRVALVRPLAVTQLGQFLRRGLEVAPVAQQRVSRKFAVAAASAAAARPLKRIGILRKAREQFRAVLAPANARRGAPARLLAGPPPVARAVEIPRDGPAGQDFRPIRPPLVEIVAGAQVRAGRSRRGGRRPVKGPGAAQQRFPLGRGDRPHVSQLGSGEVFIGAAGRVAFGRAAGDDGIAALAAGFDQAAFVLGQGGIDGELRVAGDRRLGAAVADMESGRGVRTTESRSARPGASASTSSRHCG